MNNKSNIKANSIVYLRNTIIKSQMELKHYKLLYRQECAQNKSLQKQLIKLTKHVQEIENEFKILKSQKDSSESSKQKSLSRKRKSWNKVRCERTKRKRLNEYGDYIFKSICQKVPQCKQAEVSLCMSDKMVNFSWKPRNFKHAQIKDNQYDIFNFGKNSDHSYASPKMLKCQSGEEDEDIDGIDYSRIFDCEGNWTKEHKKGHNKCYGLLSYIT